MRFKKRKLTDEWKKKIGDANRGKKHSEEYKKKMSERCKGINTWMKGRKLSEEHRKNMVDGVKRYYQDIANRKKHSIIMRNKAIRGEKHYAWKGGINSENHIIRHSPEWKEWRKKVFERDNYTCQMCGIKGNKLHPHHIFKFSQYKELRFLVSNGITLCVECHKKTLGKEDLFIEIFLVKLKK